MYAIVCIAGLILILVVVAWRSRLPSLDGRTTSTVILDTADTRLGKAIAPLIEAHPGLCGIYSLADSRDAFAARARLAEVAERTLDVQYYIWQNDMTGTLLFEALHAAADRGVRVRFLLDDNTTRGLDPTLAALDSHPNIEVRLFNPFVIRKPRLGYLTDFPRANRRMHNKSFTVDNQVTVIGGRNIGDEYFGAAAEGMLFVDVAAVGPVVTEVSRDFDRYWASASSYPLDRIVGAVEPARIADVAAAAARVERDPAALAYTAAIRDSPFIRAVVERSLEFEWAATRMISDDPAKGLGRAPPEELFHRQLRRIIGDPASDLKLIAPYLVPGEFGTDSFVSMARRGVKIKMLTNSLHASDVPVVYSGFAKRRKALLVAGITLFEMRRLSPDKGERGLAGPFGSSGSSLHAKTFAVDQSRFFVGSFNFDPRSRKLNTELGFVIDSPVLARKIEDAFQDNIPGNAYEVHLSGTGKLYWTGQFDDGVQRYDREPGTSWGLRAIIRILSLLPIEWLL